MKTFERASAESTPWDELHRKAKEVLREDAIDPESFVGVYGADAIRRDREYVRTREAQFAKEEETADPETRQLRMAATVLEAIIHEEVELSDWLGSDAHTIRPARFDDIANGVDEIVKFQEEGQRTSHLALGIDVTFSPQVRGKFERIRAEIENGELVRIKYLTPEHTGNRPGLNDVPRVVIGVDLEAVKRIGALWLEGNHRALAHHPIQVQILGEIRMQLAAFEAYAMKVGQTRIAAIYRRTAAIIERIVKGKNIASLARGAREDSTFSAIQRYLNREFSGKPAA